MVLQNIHQLLKKSGLKWIGIYTFHNVTYQRRWAILNCN